MGTYAMAAYSEAVILTAVYAARDIIIIHFMTAQYPQTQFAKIMTACTVAFLAAIILVVGNFITTQVIALGDVQSDSQSAQVSGTQHFQIDSQVNMQANAVDTIIYVVPAPPQISLEELNTVLHPLNAIGNGIWNALGGK